MPTVTPAPEKLSPATAGPTFCSPRRAGPTGTPAATLPPPITSTLSGWRRERMTEANYGRSAGSAGDAPNWWTWPPAPQPASRPPAANRRQACVGGAWSWAAMLRTRPAAALRVTPRSAHRQACRQRTTFGRVVRRTDVVESATTLRPQWTWCPWACPGTGVIRRRRRPACGHCSPQSPRQSSCEWVNFGLLIRGFGVRVPGGAPGETAGLTCGYSPRQDHLAGRPDDLPAAASSQQVEAGSFLPRVGLRLLRSMVDTAIGCRFWRGR